MTGLDREKCILGAVFSPNGMFCREGNGGLKTIQLLFAWRSGSEEASTPRQLCNHILNSALIEAQEQKILWGEKKELLETAMAMYSYK
jgi:hypothetical protein